MQRAAGWCSSPCPEMTGPEVEVTVTERQSGSDRAYAAHRAVGTSGIVRVRRAVAAMRACRVRPEPAGRDRGGGRRSWEHSSSWGFGIRPIWLSGSPDARRSPWTCSMRSPLTSRRAGRSSPGRRRCLGPSDGTVREPRFLTHHSVRLRTRCRDRLECPGGMQRAGRMQGRRGTQRLGWTQGPGGRQGPTPSRPGPRPRRLHPAPGPPVGARGSGRGCRGAAPRRRSSWRCACGTRSSTPACVRGTG